VLYFAWQEDVLVILMTWVDDVMVLGPLSLVDKVQQDLEWTFTCKCQVKFTKCVGSKITIDRASNSLGTVKFMQPVLVHKLVEENKLMDGPHQKH